MGSQLYAHGWISVVPDEFEEFKSIFFGVVGSCLCLPTDDEFLSLAEAKRLFCFTFDANQFCVFISVALRLEYHESFVEAMRALAREQVNERINGDRLEGEISYLVEDGSDRRCTLRMCEGELTEHWW